MRSQTDCGGIPFQRENIPYPDTDDTSLVVLALNDMDLGPDEPAKRDVTSSALRWLLFMQGDDGGWAAFGKNQSVKTTATPVFKDDPPTADVTGHVLSSLKLAPAFGFADRARSAISSGISWLKRTQLPRGEWFGRWGLTYTYGTTAVLQGLSDLGQPLGQSFVQSGVQYLLNTQKPDGGWGEGYVTYYNFQAQDDSPSTATQTAWSLLGLMSVPRTAAVDQAVERGVQFLVDRYDSQKGWEQPEYTEGALWIYKNRLYPLMWGVWALSTYRKRMAA